MLDSNSTAATAKLCFENSAVATAELQNSENQIDIFHTLSIPEYASKHEQITCLLSFCG